MNLTVGLLNTAEVVRPAIYLHAISTACPNQAAAYGACVNAKYMEVEKDMCREQFVAFKQCVTKSVGPADLAFAARDTQIKNGY